MNKKSVLLVFLGYAIWGFQPLFWNLLGNVDSLLTLAFRIIWSAIFTVGLLKCTRQLPKLWALFRDWKKMRFMIPAAAFMFLDWALFLYAVQSGHVLDTSLGYFMSPLMTILISFFIFREKIGPLQLLAIVLVVTGVVLSAVQYGSVPVLSLILSMTSVYACLKKFAKVEPLVSIAAETLMMLPFALVYVLFFRLGDVVTFGLTDQLLLIASGVVTAVPMTLYAVGINQMPFLMLGFSQYISPSLSLMCGLLMGELVTTNRLVTFAFTWAGIAVYMIYIVREERKKKQALIVCEAGEK